MSTMKLAILAAATTLVLACYLSIKTDVIFDHPLNGINQRNCGKLNGHRVKVPAEYIDSRAWIQYKEENVWDAEKAFLPNTCESNISSLPLQAVLPGMAAVNGDEKLNTKLIRFYYTHLDWGKPINLEIKNQQSKKLSYNKVARDKKTFNSELDLHYFLPPVPNSFRLIPKKDNNQISRIDCHPHVSFHACTLYATSIRYSSNLTISFNLNELNNYREILNATDKLVQTFEL